MRSLLFRSFIMAIGLFSLVGCPTPPDSKPKPDKPPKPKPPATAPAPETKPAIPTPPIAVTIKQTEIPPGFDFPGVREDIQLWADTWDLTKITPKAWDLWAGMTSPTGQISEGVDLPVWETWCGQEEVFAKVCGTLLRPSRPFRNAHQLTHMAKLKGTKDTSSNFRLVSFNKFNPSMVSYLMTAQPGPGGKTFDYTQMQSLADLNSAWPAETPTADRKVQETPYIPPSAGSQGSAAIETKPVMFLVKKTGLSPVPLWKGIAGANPSSDSDCSKGPTDKCHPAPNLWTTCVLLDPANSGTPDTKPVPATPEQIKQVPESFSKAFACKEYLYAPLSSIYAIKLDAEEAADFNTVGGESGDILGATAEAGDYAVLTAMHVSTKEITNWTWQTFWWQPGEDAPDNFPGSKAGITDKVKGSWRNYAMCTGYNQTQGKDSKKMVVCFNPYLETSSGIPDGVQSNCMSCHGVATVNSTISGSPAFIGTLSYPSAYKTAIDFTTDPQFKGYTRTDFSWAIPGDAVAPSAASVPSPAPGK